MTQLIKESIAALLNVKIFVTIVLTIVFAYLSIVGKIEGNDFITVFMVVITFYFVKDNNNNINKKDNQIVKGD